jgi:hypothetical protein
MGYIDYERKDYKQLAKEFGLIKIGKYGIKFLPRDPIGRVYKLMTVTPLTGWITEPKEVERVIRENGMEL